MPEEDRGAAESIEGYMALLLAIMFVEATISGHGQGAYSWMQAGCSPSAGCYGSSLRAERANGEGDSGPGIRVLVSLVRTRLQ